MKSKKGTLIIDWKKINFEKRYSPRAKNIRISINSEYKVILIIPKWPFQIFKDVMEKKAIKFLEQKSSWVIKNIEKSKQKLNPNTKIESRSHYLKHKKDAEILCEEKCKFWSKKMWLKYNRICIKSMKTKWGSCSSKKNLNFNYKILFLKPEEQNYLVVHELSHLKHMNHSKNFWDLVCKTLENEKFRKYKILN